MIAAFLKTVDGNFDVPAFALSLGLLIFAAYVLIWKIPTILRRGHTRVRYFWYGDVYELDRVGTPKTFWFNIALLVVGALLCLVSAFVFSTGMMRDYH